MLMICPECGLPVSDKAIACPHCGYPIQPDIVKQRKPRNKNNKRRRLPNGFGQISEIKNRNLRNPFRAMVTIGKNASGRPICKPLKPESYFPTYNDAYAALVEYNKNPYSLEDSITVQELFNRWSEEHFSKLTSSGSIQGIKTAWAYCSLVYNMRAIDIRGRHIKKCMEEGVASVHGVEQNPPATMQNKIKSIFNQMFDYALEYELVTINYSRTFTLSEEVIKEIQTTKNPHIPYTSDEIMVMWDNLGTLPFIDVVLIQCYSGWRPQELQNLELEHVNLDDWTFIGGMKTPSSIERLVPIHTKIRPLIEKRYQEAKVLGSKYLINDAYPDRQGKSMAFTQKRFEKWLGQMKSILQLNPAHRPHDGRKHFVTMAKKYNLDEYAIKYIVGHKITDITEKIYTKREISWLREEIEKIEKEE